MNPMIQHVSPNSSKVKPGASVWPGSVLRGDLNKITVGFCSNVQERCVLHAAWSSPTGIGNVLGKIPNDHPSWR